MKVYCFILVLCYHIQNATTNPPDSPWRRSRYIIDNRRNALFSKKLPPTPPDLRYNEPLKQRLYPVERYHKDLAAEASISEPKFFRKYNDNSLPRKVVKSYKITDGLRGHEYNGIYESQKNATGDLDFLNEDVLNDVGKVTSVSVMSTPTTPKVEPGLATTTTTDGGNQIDEKHVYETRIETVSYHQEVIFPKKDTWYRKEQSGGYEEPEKNYEQPEENYEEPEQPEENYEEPEKNYEMDEEQNKFGYVVEGTNYRKYRVEERTADGFIVGEYGVVSHDDGSLRGVRYTADGDTNPKLIYETLIKFLSL